MAAIVATSMQGTGARAVTITTLGASDTFTYNPSANPILLLRNTTGGGLTPNIDGSGGTTVPVAGIGDVTVSAGITLASIAATTGFVAIPLKSIEAYLQGTVTVTGGSGISASLLEF